MPRAPQFRSSQRLLVVMPTWLGDVVMATPTLRALRALFPAAHITALSRRHLRPILDGCPWINRQVSVPPRDRSARGLAAKRANMFRLARRIGAAKFDTVVLLPNSFRSALLMRMAGVPRRVGYDRDGRGGLLTDRLLPRRDNGRFVPVPTLDYYLGLARYLGAKDPSAMMQLFTRPSDDARAAAILHGAGVPDGPGGKPLVILNPGANYGDAKMWYPDRFAAVADRCVRELGAAVAVSGAAKERAILDAVHAAAREPLLDLPRLGVDLSLLKSIIRRSQLLITNDTGPRHIAAAFGVPVITVFGPTDPAWTVINFDRERQVSVPVFCGPCQLKKCPLDHRCMTLVTPEMVFERAAELLGASIAQRSTTPSIQI